MSFSKLLLIVLPSAFLLASCGGSGEDASGAGQADIVFKDGDPNQSVKSFRGSNKVEPVDNVIACNFKGQEFRLFFPETDELTKILEAIRYLSVEMTEDGYRFDSRDYQLPGEVGDMEADISKFVEANNLDTDSGFHLEVKVDPEMKIESALAGLESLIMNIKHRHRDNMTVSSDVFGSFLEYKIDLGDWDNLKPPSDDDEFGSPLKDPK